jgi:putative ABC transport system ATP-binding protein
MIELRSVGKDYTRGPETIAALDGVDLTIARGEYLALVGPSGSGKSTLMNIIGCLDVPTRGSYRLRGVDTATLDDDALSDIRNREIGFIFQSFFLLPRKTALENVIQPLMYREMLHVERVEHAMAALEKVGLGDRMQHLPNELSGGQRQRVAIARAMVGAPLLLLADEPTGNLDSRTADEILDLFSALNSQGHTILIVTHEPSIAARCARMIGMSDGRLVQDRRPPLHA